MTGWKTNKSRNTNSNCRWNYWLSKKQRETALNTEHVVCVGFDGYSPEVWPDIIFYLFPIPVTIWSGMMSDSDCSLRWIRITSDVKMRQMFTVNRSQSQASHSCIHCNLSVKYVTGNNELPLEDSLSFLWKCGFDIPNAALLTWSFCQITGLHHHKLRAEVRNALWQSKRTKI